ncbi:hypothetical protein BS50DRAFT_219659 [Corynespora cassiicola Philippines]|uniref:Uncharacterized protein n=1 Tax=Corynespora cassiicola Philippines TaxID=1448308 RepID=A0A2T2N308_CORCC|nr:hypothetical protein BS50DRAFT_219659 [Corynespora cassiicola Philippines]
MPPCLLNTTSNPHRPSSPAQPHACNRQNKAPDLCPRPAYAKPLPIDPFKSPVSTAVASGGTRRHRDWPFSSTSIRFSRRAAAGQPAVQPLPSSVIFACGRIARLCYTVVDSLLEISASTPLLLCFLPCALVCPYLCCIQLRHILLLTAASSLKSDAVRCHTGADRLVNAFLPLLPRG